MKQAFVEHIFRKQQHKQPVPSNEVISGWAQKLVCVMYPELSECTYPSVEAIEHELLKLEAELVCIMDATKACDDCDNKAIGRLFFQQLPTIYKLLNSDIEAIHNGDPAAQNEFEVIRAYPGFIALACYRIAHSLYSLKVPLLPRILTEVAHGRTGIDIHPASQIGEYFMIDHGTGIVIGETSIIGRNVKIYQGVTLGALSVNKNMSTQKRHPTIEDNVVIYSGATILGGDTIVGEGSVIGGNVWLTSSVPPKSLVYHSPEITVVEGKYNNEVK